MPTKFYFRRTTQTITGTAPATNATTSAKTPTWTPGASNSVVSTPLLTNYSLSPTIGSTAQTTLAYTTDNVTTNQQQPLLRFVSTPLLAQVINAQAITVRLGLSQSSTVSAFTTLAVVTVWRPSTGTVVGRFSDGTVSSPQPGTSQTDISNSIASGSTSIVACQDGDLLVVEIWRGVGLQTMGTSYTNTIAYDGRTEGSTSDNAGYIQFTTSVVLQSDLPNTAAQGPSDTFGDNTINTGLWGVWGTGTQVEGGGVLTQGATGVGGEWVGIVSNSTYNFTNRSLVAQIAQFPNVAQYNLCVLRAELDANNAYILAYDNGNLAVQWQHSGTTDTSGTPAAVPPGTIGLKIVFDDAGGGRVWWCSTTDGINWKVLGHNTGYTTPWTALKVVLSAGCISGVASPGTVKWESTGVAVGAFKNLTGAAAGRAVTDLAFDEYGQTIKGTSSLVAYWRLNEAAGPTAYDVKGLHHGTYVGGQYNVYYRVPGSGAPSDGKDPGVMLGGGWIDIPDWPITGAFTIEFWAKVIFFAPNGTFINRRTVGNVGGFSLECGDNPDGTLNFHLYDTGWKTASTWRPLAADQWHHFVARYDAAGGMSVLINGSIEASAGVGTLNNPTGAAIQFARSVINGGLLTDPDWTAPFDELAIYNTHLTQAVIQDHYRKGVKARDTYGQLIEGTSGLVAYWRTHETGTANLFDESGNGLTLRANPNGVTQNVAGIPLDTPSLALSMDGTSNATIDSASYFSALDFVSGSFTFEGWFYRSNVAGYFPIFEYSDNSTASGIHLWLYDNEQTLYANFRDSTLVENVIQSGPIVSHSTWHHVVMLRRVNTGELWFDNQLIGTIDLTGKALRMNLPFNIGWRTGTSWFNGKFAQFAAYNVALTATQIDQRWQLLGAAPGQVPASSAAGKATCVGAVDKGALPTVAVGPVDTFSVDGVLDPQWTNIGTLGTRSIAAGIINLGAPVSTPAGYCGIISTNSYNLSDKIVYVEIVSRASLQVSSNTYLRVEDSAASNWYFDIGQSGASSLMASVVENGSYVATPFITWPANTRFLRMLFDPTGAGHRVYFQSSTDGTAWTTVGTYFTSRSLASWKVSIRAYAGNLASPGISQWDNFNYPGWIYKNLTGTSNGSSVAAASTLTRAKSVAPITGGVCGAAAVGMLSRRNDRVAYPIQIRQVIPVEYSGASVSSVSFPIPLAVAPGGHLIGIWFNGTANPGSEGALYKWGALKTQGSYSGTAALLKTSGYTYDRSAQVTASPVSSVMANRYWGTGVSVVYTNYSTFTAIRGVILEVVGLQKDTNAPWTAVASNYGNNTTMTVTAPNAQNTPAVAALAVVVDMSITAGRTYNVSPANWTRQYSYPDGTATLPSGAIEWNQDINILNPPSLTASWVTPATAWYVALNLYLKGIAPGLVGATNGRATDVAAIYGTGTPKTIFTSANTNPSNGVSACVGQPSSRPRSTVLGGPTADTFTSGTLDPQWTYFGTPGVQNVSGGTLNLGVPTSTAASIGVQSTTTTYDLTGKMVVAEIFARPATASGSKTWLKITQSQPTIYAVWIGSSGSNLVAEANWGSTTVTVLATMAWPAGLRAVRIIAEPMGQTGNTPGSPDSVRWLFEYTIDGVRWLTLHQVSRIAGGVGSTNARVYIAAECTTPIAGPGTAQWDNVNVIPFPWVSYKDLTGSAAGRTLDYRAVIMADNPVAYWRLGEASGTTAADSTANNNTGTYAGGYLVGQPGATKNDYATTLNNGVINVPDSASLRTQGATGGWSMEAWIKPTALSGIQEFYRKGADYFFRSSGSDFQSFWRFTGGANTQPQGGTIPSTTNWTHVVATYDKTNIKHYVNGALVYTVAETRTLEFTTVALAIGAQSSGGGEFLNGGIDEVAVYNYALTLPQIQTHYNAASGGYGGVVGKQPWLVGSALGFGGPRKLYNTIVLADGPLLYWKMDETTGYVAADSSGSNRTGTITGKVGYSSPPGIGEGTSLDFLGTSTVMHTMAGWSGGTVDAGPPAGMILPNPTGSVMRSPGYTGTTFNAPGIWRWYPNVKVDVNNAGDLSTPFGEFVAWNLTKNAICNNYPPGGSGGTANGHFQPNMFQTSYVSDYSQTGRNIDFYWNGTDSIELRMTRNGTSTVRVFTMTDGWLVSPGWILGPYHTIFNNGAWTVECWVKGTYLAGKYYGILMCADTWGTNSKALHILIRDRKPYIGFYSDDFDSNTVITDNVWHHLVFTYTGSVTKQQDIYIDGVRVGTGRLASTGLLVTSGAYTSWAGQPGFWVSKSQWDYNPGFMDELAIYNYAFPLSQAQAHYAVGPVTRTQIGISLGTHTYLDTFDRADSDTVGGLWSETIGDWDVVNNGLRSMGGASDQLILNSTLIGTADYKVVTSVTPGDMWNGSRGVGVIARWVDVNNFYMAWCDGFDDTIKLYRGGFTQIGTYTPVPIPPSPFTLGLSVNKSTIEVELNGVVVISTTDATHTAEGDFGLRTWDAVDFQDHLFNYLYVDALTLPGQIPSVSSTGGSSVTAVLTTKKRLTVASAGVAAVTAVIYRKKAMVVASAGVATVSVAISRRRSLVVSSAGAATEVGQPARYFYFTVSSTNGKATTVGTVIKTAGTIASGGSSAGVAVASAQVRIKKALVGSSQGTAVTNTATILRRRALVAASAGVATEVGQPTAYRRIVAASAGVTTEAGQPTVRKSLGNRTSTGVAVATGAMTRRKSMVVTAAGISAVTGQILIRTTKVDGTANGVAVANATAITRRRPVSLTSAAGVAIVTSALTRLRAITAASAGKATTTATATRRRPIVATAVGVAACSGVTTRRRRIVGTTVGVATTNDAIILRYRAIVGSSDGNSATFTVNPTRKRRLVGTTVGIASCRGRVVNVAIILWNGSTFALTGNYPVVLWNEEEFLLEGPEDLDLVAYRESTDQFNRVP